MRAVVGGRAVVDGRTLDEWVPRIVGQIMVGCDPIRVIVFGSVARGDDGPDSDIDLLVELDSIAPSTKMDRMVEVRHLVKAPVPVDVLVTDREDLARRADLPGILRVALREGRTAHERSWARTGGPEAPRPLPHRMLQP